MPIAELTVALTAATADYIANMKRAQATTDTFKKSFGSLLALGKGAFGVAAVDAFARGLEGVAERAIDIKDAFDEGELSVGQMVEEFVAAIPVIGQIRAAGVAISDSFKQLFLGIQPPRKAEEDAKAFVELSKKGLEIQLEARRISEKLLAPKEEKKETAAQARLRAMLQDINVAREAVGNLSRKIDNEQVRSLSQILDIAKQQLETAIGLAGKKREEEKAAERQKTHERELLRLSRERADTLKSMREDALGLTRDQIQLREFLGADVPLAEKREALRLFDEKMERDKAADEKKRIDALRDDARSRLRSILDDLNEPGAQGPSAGGVLAERGSAEAFRIINARRPDQTQRSMDEKLRDAVKLLRDQLREEKILNRKIDNAINKAELF